MLPGKGTLKKEHKADAVKGVQVLKAGVAFGANASGKSNLIKAIAFGKRLVTEGSMAGMPIEFSKFRLDAASVEKGSRLEYEIQAGGKNYAYGFVLNNGYVAEEWLYEISKKSETRIYERQTDEGIFDVTYLMGLQKNQEEQQFMQFLSKATPKNQLFLHEVMTRNVKGNVSNTTDLDNVLNWFLTTLTVIFPRDKYKSGIKLMAADNEQLKKYYTELLRYFDTGIKTICLQSVKENKTNISEEQLEQIKMDLMKQNNAEARVSLTNGRDNYFLSLDGINLRIQNRISDQGQQR